MGVSPLHGHYGLQRTRQQNAWCTDLKPSSWVQILSLPCLTLSKLFNFLLTQFPHLQHEEIVTAPCPQF